ncbi:interleukin-18 receptor accessory protein-like [Lytechinus pictus]|uniref:interleukin-18 receptor accessory protein-like n=1 Tax=Lytechinus pictus TaxID=7653 RepID=UPI0030B9CF7A
MTFQKMLVTGEMMKDHGLLCISFLICSLLLLYSPIISGELQDICLEGKIVPCRDNLNGSSLMFLDPTPQPHISVVRGKYLSPSLSCKAEGFTNITWLKDDRFEFPFGFEPDSTLCSVHLKDCNQTVEITDTQKDAIGNYTCLVSNGRQTIQRTFTLNVEDEDFTDDPYTIDHDNCSDVGVERGQDIFIFCEFCAEVRAQQTDVRWYKLDEDEDLVPINQLIGEEDEEESRYWESANIHTRDCLKTYNLPAAVGRKLIIRDVTPNEFGRYVIIANYTLDGESKEGRIDITVSRAPYVIIEITVGIVVSLTVTFLLVTIVTVMCHRHHLTLQLYWKNRFGKIEEHDGMEYDAFISFSDSLEDTRFAIALAQLLEKGYKVWMRDMHAIPGEALIAEEIVNMKRSRRCILIISPDYPMSSHSEVLTDLAADQTLRKQSRIIPILYRDVNKEHLKRYRRLAEIVRVCPCIVWKETGEQLETQPSSGIGWKSVEDGGGTSGCDLEEISSNHVSDVGKDCSNRFGSGTAGITSDSNLPNGDDHESVDSNQSRKIGDSHITSTNNSDIGKLDYHSKNDMRMTPRDGDLDHIDVDSLACRSDHGMRKTLRDGDLDQLIDDQEDEESKKRKMKWKKQKEGYEKKLLLKMPPKRAVAKPDGNEAPTVV